MWNMISHVPDKSLSIEASLSLVLLEEGAANHDARRVEVRSFPLQRQAWCTIRWAQYRSVGF